jgi:hypothetical protein
LSSELPEIGWICELARPYLRGYRARAQSAGPLRGFWFTCNPAKRSRAGKIIPTKKTDVGFFAGYLLAESEKYDLRAQPPEALVFAFVQPAGGALHTRLVADEGSLLRRTFNYIRWLTHRPPRFEFHDAGPMALVRHISMCDWPPAQREHLARNFFIETLAWLVRSGLVRKLQEASTPARRARSARKVQSQ